MKLINYVKCNYFGITLNLHPDVQFITVSEGGWVLGHIAYPELKSTGWESASYLPHVLGQVDLEGTDWKTTLRNVAECEVNMLIQVDYFGAIFTVPVRYKYLAADADGTVCAYEETPIIVGNNKCWTENLESDSCCVAEIDLDEMDWRDTFMEVVDCEVK